MDRERLTKREVSEELYQDGIKAVIIKILENNTFEITYPSGVKAIRYHHTDIITYQVNGDIVLNSDGWMTPTTRDRLRNYLPAPWTISQINKIWYLANNSKSYTFKDGITIHHNGTVSGNGTDPKELLKLDKRIQGYVAGYIKALFGGKIEKPDSGDCWGCLMKDEKTGKAFMGNDHFISHFDEKYYVPSLLMNAVETFPVSIAARSSIGYWVFKMEDQKSEWFDSIAKIQIKSSLRRYLRRQLGLAA